MKEKASSKNLNIINERELIGEVIYQELLTKNNVFVERYLLPDKRTSREILIFVGLNILPSTKYFGHFPFNLCKETESNVSVVYEIGCSGRLNRYFRRFTQEEAEEQYLAGLEITRGFKGKVIIFSHSASTIEHLKLVFDDKYKNFSEGIDIAGGIISSTVTNILVELRNVWPNYKLLNWKNIMLWTRFSDIPLPVYPYFSKARHARYSPMNNLSIWINSKTAEFLLSTDIRKIISNGKYPDYPLLIFIPKHDILFNPVRQEKLAKYISKKANATIVKCDAEHNLFLSDGTFPLLKPIKEYLGRVCK